LVSLRAQIILALSHHTVGRLTAIGPAWLAPDNILHWFGPLAVLGVLALVFAETGLLVGFFLPGDSLLFTAGLLTVTGFITMPVIVLAVLVFLAAFVGDQVGFMIGRRAGPRIFTRPDSRLFRQEYVEKTNAFFVRYGGRAVILARFVPIVRTFAPVAAGVGAMRYRQFVGFNAIGAFAWGTGVTLLGAWLGQFDFVRANIELILIAIVAISVVPIAAQLLRAKRRTASENIASRTAAAHGQPS
jgi:membrane-associated protein